MILLNVKQTCDKHSGFSSCVLWQSSTININNFISNQAADIQPPCPLPELEEVLEVVPEDWDCSNAGLVDTLLLVLVPSSAVFLKKLCCRA